MRTINCPTCKKILEKVADDFPSRPFCSGRCKLADLDNWLNERYTISRPLVPGEDDEGLH